ncbi:MAG TPA: PspC domain-containing protein [bacterium]|nr:PspC domain-containing protein [bacterium]
MAKRFLRSKDDRIIAGVCGGLGDYLNIDPVIIRIIWLVLFFAGGVGLLAYIVAMIIVPSENDSPYNEKKAKKTSGEEKGGKLIGGIVLVVIGILFLLDKNWYFSELFEDMIRLGWKFFLPAVFIGIGIYLISQSRSKSDNKSQPDESKEEQQNEEEEK